MKYRHKCEWNGCNKSANRRAKNGHWFCHDCFKALMDKHRRLGHNSFVKEIQIGSLGKYKIFIDKFMKFI